MLFTRAFRVFLALILLSLQLRLEFAHGASQESPRFVDPKAGPPPTLEQVVAKLAVRAEKLGCKSDNCALLVLNFASTSDSTVMLDVKLSDQLASIFAKTLPQAKIVERSNVREFLASERIPYQLLKSPSARGWLGRELGATMVLAGDLNVSGSVPQAMFSLFDTQAPDKADYFGTELPVDAYSPGDLKPSEPFGPPETPKTTKSGATVYPSGTVGLSPVSCNYMPNPEYTEAARELQLSGVILIDAVVTPEGKIESPQIKKGMPGGLNEVTRKTVETWRCKPPMKDNQPVATVVQFEVNFR